MTLRKTTKVYDVLCLKSTAALEQKSRDGESVLSSKSDSARKISVGIMTL